MHLDRAAGSGRCWHRDRSSRRDSVVTGNETCWTALALLELRVARLFCQPAVPVKWCPLKAHFIY